MSMERSARLGVTILGAGRYGLTLAECAARNGQQVVLWAERPAVAKALTEKRALPAVLPELEVLHEAVEVTARLDRAVRASHTLVVAVRAADVRPLARKLGEFADPSQVIVHVVRGLEPGTLERPSRVLRRETALRKVGAMLGPALVDEMLAGRPNAFVVASRYPEVAERMTAAFAHDTLRVYTSSDLAGVEIAAAAASVGAVAVGIALELALGPATLGMLLTRSAAEMARVVEASGGKAATAWGLAGLGELLALRESESREVRAGRALARGMSVKELEQEFGSLDAMEAARTFVALARRLGVHAHIAGVVARVLDGELAAGAGVLELMRLDPMAE
jgi:glycerol-3-phosphate dehydrogenase (NAD(P)+)